MKKYLLPLLLASSLQAATTYNPIQWSSIDTNHFTTNSYVLSINTNVFGAGGGSGTITNSGVPLTNAVAKYADTTGDHLTPSNVLIDSNNNLSTTGSITGLTFIDEVGDLRDDIDNKLPSSVTIDDIPDAETEWTLKKTIHNTLAMKPVYYDYTNHTGSAFMFAWTNTPPEINIYITDDFTLSVDTDYAPASNTLHGATWTAVYHAPDDANYVMTISEDLTSTTDNDLVEILAGETITMWIKWTGTNGTYYYAGSEAGQLSTTKGGTGTPYGMATAPLYTVYSNPFYSATNLIVNFGYGQVMADSGLEFIKINTNIMFVSSSGRSPAPGLELRQSCLIYNTNATGTNYALVRDEWFRAGFPVGTNAVEIPAGSIVQLDFLAKGTTENKVTVINNNATTFIVSSGGSAPAGNTLTNGLAQYWNFEQSSTSTLTNAVSGGQPLYQVGTAWTKGLTGKIGNSWSNTVSSSIFTNNNAALDFGRAGASYSVSGWVKPNATTTTRLLGQGNTSDNSWYFRLSSGAAKWEFTQFTEAGASVQSVNALPAVVADTWAHFACVFDNANDIQRIYIDGVETDSTVFTGNVYDSTVAFSLGGIYVSGAASSGRAAWDEVGIWTRAINPTEVEALYNGGAGTNLNALLNP